MRNLPPTRHTRHTRHTPLSLTRRRIALKSFLPVGLPNGGLCSVEPLKTSSLRIKHRLKFSLLRMVPPCSVYHSIRASHQIQFRLLGKETFGSVMFIRRLQLPSWVVISLPLDSSQIVCEASLEVKGKSAKTAVEVNEEPETLAESFQMGGRELH